MSTTEATWLTTVARSGATEAEFIARLMPAAQRAAAVHEHPALPPRRRVRRGHDSRDGPVALRDEKFAYRLEVVLDGLALRLNR